MKTKKRFKGSKLSLLFMLMFVIVLAGCGNDEASPATGSSGTSGGQEASENIDTIAAIKERGKVIAGVKYDTRLFGLKDPISGNVEGFDIDMAKALAKKILGDETKVELKEVTSKTRTPLLQNGEIDIIIATMTITEDRKKEVDFSDVYFNAGQSLLVAKGSPITGIDSLNADTTVLAVKGSTSVTNIKEKAPDAKVLEFENYQEAFTALKANKGDVLTTDNSILLGMMQDDPNFEMVGDIFTDEPYGMAIRKGDQQMVDTVNEMLQEMKDSGEYDELYEKWLGTSPPSAE
ncbi:glutamate ABC transporter substrate-binding protein [Paenibacillus urinalis]|uniref:Glutamate ABC transporter substrate-binding protein n=1 Tax=Paenibacillus urinalis TaxID=521520 RepID=A0ABY7XA89_9BACL|nr:glutamate ABC transporter substrate-binding protein [Paenibacillus urinalis]WDH99014.1 glutamate ABC transporter substrate-binding protein [Paenibacillus urinalis]WDI02708.1 glutamate ABC transporter substrate-binding protein [Paenibacillus urinalis]